MTQPTSRNTTHKPCPFCGGVRLGYSVVPNTGGNVQYVQCLDCQAKGPWADFGAGKNRALLWERRVGAPVSEKQTRPAPEGWVEVRVLVKDGYGPSWRKLVRESGMLKEVDHE